MGADAMPSAKAVADAEIGSIRDWVVRQGLASDDLPALLGGFCERLVTLGVPLWRGHMSLPMLHPMYEAIGYTWRRGQRLTHDQYQHGSLAGDVWQRSPLRLLVENGVPRMRKRLERGEGGEFPVLAGLRNEGGTDWFGRLIGFGHGTQRPGPRGMVTSWTSDLSGGFGDADIALIESLVDTLALAVYRIALLQVAVDLLDAYVGPEPGRRILGGQVRQGTAQQVSAAIVIADLRGFTAVADRTPAERLVAGLNEHLGAVVEAVDQHRGQVLKFLGDGLMAVFSLEDRPAHTACTDALAAAQGALAANAAINGRRAAAGEAVLALDIALHLGQVMYGNVGSARRLDFTVIGPAVNEASRIEALCEPLGCHLLTSAAFAEACPRALRSLGQHTLRGVASSQELFTLA
jgi:adenylate cyclase